MKLFDFNVFAFNFFSLFSQIFCSTAHELMAQHNLLMIHVEQGTHGQFFSSRDFMKRQKMRLIFPPWKSISLFGKHNRLFHSCPITILSFKLDICDRWWWELAVLVHIIYHERKPTNICIHISEYKRKYTVFQKQIYSAHKSKHYLTKEWMTSLLFYTENSIFYFIVIYRYFVR